MGIEPLMGLPEAAKQMGISRRTLRNWLRDELGIVFPHGKRGIKRLVRIRDLELLIRIHAGYPDLTRANRGSRSAAA